MTCRGGVGGSTRAMRYLFGEYQLDTERRTLEHAGVPVKLERKVYQVLTYLVQHREHLVPREELLEHVWPGVYVAEAVVTRCIAALRKAVGDDRERQDAPPSPPAYAAAPVPSSAWRAATGCVDLDAAVATGLPSSTPSGSLGTGKRKLVTVLCCPLDRSEGDPTAPDPEARYTLLQALVDVATPA